MYIRWGEMHLQCCDCLSQLDDPKIVKAIEKIVSKADWLGHRQLKNVPCSFKRIPCRNIISDLSRRLREWYRQAKRTYHDNHGDNCKENCEGEAREYGGHIPRCRSSWLKAFTGKWPPLSFYGAFELLWSGLLCGSSGH